MNSFTFFIFVEFTWTITILAMIGKFGITISYGIIYVMTAELFPTCVRYERLKLITSTFLFLFPNDHVQYTVCSSVACAWPNKNHSDFIELILILL